MADRLYFAYGSNINLYQMDYRCPDATVVGPVALENYELLFRRGGFATIRAQGGRKGPRPAVEHYAGVRTLPGYVRRVSPLLR